MSVALLAPLGLAALAALALPLLLHLVRRLELETTEFAALRWIVERVRPRRHLRFERPWLLALRLALLAALALLLARPVSTPPAQPVRSVVAVVPGVDRAVARAALPDAAAADWRWLGAGFPPLAADPPSAVPVASLLRELDASLPPAAMLHIVAPAELDGLDGERPKLARAVDWKIVPGRMTEPVVAPSPPMRFAVRYAPEAEPALVYLRAAVAAWNLREPGRYVLDAQPVSVSIPNDAGWLAWLAPRTPALDAWIERGGVALLIDARADGDALWRDAHGEVHLREAAQGRGRVLALSGALTPAELPRLLDADFPDRLLAALRGAPSAPTRTPADAVRPAIGAAAPGTSAALSSAKPLDAWLVLVVALLFALERVVATHRRAEPSS